MKKALVLISVFSVLIFTGCGHTNELAKYDLQSKTFYFEDGVASDAQSVSVNFTTPLGTEKSFFSSGGFSAALDVAEAVSSVASAVISADATQKLERAVDVNEMAYYVSEGMEKALVRYYDIQGVESQNESMFIVETILTKCQLGSNETGVGILVEATSRIIDRQTATVVWEYEGTNVVPIRESGGYSIDRTVNTVSSVIGAAQLVDLSEEEIRTRVYNAASGAGAQIAEVLREDISEVRSNK